MLKRNGSIFRLALNAVGTFIIAVLGLSTGLPGLIGLATGFLHFGSDPDGGDKVLAIQVFSALVGAIALVSFIGSVIALRRFLRG